MTHHKFDVTRLNLMFSDGVFFADTDTVKGSNDGIRKAILLCGALTKVLNSKLLKAISTQRWGTCFNLAFWRWVNGSILENHAAGQHDNAL